MCRSTLISAIGRLALTLALAAACGDGESAAGGTGGGTAGGSGGGLPSSADNMTAAATATAGSDGGAGEASQSGGGVSTESSSADEAGSAEGASGGNTTTGTNDGDTTGGSTAGQDSGSTIGSTIGDTTGDTEGTSSSSGDDTPNRGMTTDEPETTGPMGTPCSPDNPCEDEMVCDFSDGLCGQGDDGICFPLPPNCPPVVNPVCGCDGVNYDNICLALVSGTDQDETDSADCQDP
ncbi:MAG: hypothetical protein JKY37_10290 [Nannocystaceae bacterium]|nr:hypothetical protein [Nannocystaceae bacterium]